MVTVAVHEAAHAAAMIEHGWLFDRVYVRDPHAPGLPDGIVTHRAGAVWVTTPERQRENLVQALAGYLAEEIYDAWWSTGEISSCGEREAYLRAGLCLVAVDPNGPLTIPIIPHLASAAVVGHDPFALPRHIPDDWVRAAHLAWALGGRTPQEHQTILRAAEIETEALLVRRWEAIVRLARSLCRRTCGYMTYRQVCCLLGEQPRTDQPAGVRDIAD